MRRASASESTFWNGVVYSYALYERLKILCIWTANAYTRAPSLVHTKCLVIFFSLLLVQCFCFVLRSLDRPTVCSTAYMCIGIWHILNKKKATEDIVKWTRLRVSLSLSLYMYTVCLCWKNILRKRVSVERSVDGFVLFSLSLSFALHALCHSNQTACLCAKHSMLANGHTGSKLQPGHNSIDATTYAIFITEFHSFLRLNFCSLCFVASVLVPLATDGRDASKSSWWW